MKTVNPQEIEQLYEFTRAHYVDYYDLQTELVDHLANDIEAIWEMHPDLTFDQARDTSFKKFGIFGFMEVMGQRAKAMNMRYLRFLWKELKQWFSLPKALITITVFIAFYMAFSTSIAIYLSIFFYVLLIVFGSYKAIMLRRQYNMRQKKTNKKWLLEELIFKQAGGTVFLLFYQMFHVFQFTDFIFSNAYMILGFSLLFTLMSLFMYISFQVLPEKSEDLLKETYPEFSL